MRTLAILGALLLAFIGASLYVQHDLRQAGAELTEMLQDIATAVEGGDWPGATATIASLEKRWREVERRWNLFTEHEELDDINGTLSRLQGSLLSHDTTGAMSEVQAALHLFRHIPEKESLSWVNIL